MNNTLQFATLFLAELGLGSAMVLPLIPVRVTGKSFVRFYYGFILMALALFLFCMARLEQFHYNYALALALGAWIWLLSFTKIQTRLEEILLRIFAAFSFCVLILYAQKFAFSHAETYHVAIQLCFFVVATVFLVFHLMNMIFGHWYLINRQLPIAHLVKSTKILTLVSYVRILAVTMATLYASQKMEASAFERLLDIRGHGIFFWARVLAGLGIPLLVSHLAHASAKIGSNQSATGIMYAGTIFVLMGELLGLYLFFVTGYFF